METDSQSTGLPSPREMLTSLINSISSIPVPDEDDGNGEGEGEGDGTRDHLTAATSTSTSTATTKSRSVTQDKRPPPPSSANPLAQIPAAHHPLFTALHALFPSLLLPALDLLDRGLVTRMDLDGHGHGHNPGDDGGGGVGPTSVYHVRSAQQQAESGGRRKWRSGGDGSGVGAGAGTGAGLSGGLAYIVQLRAWNCSCAAFAFAAFPTSGGSGDGGQLFATTTVATTTTKPGTGNEWGLRGEAEDEEGEEEDEWDEKRSDGEDEEEATWQFGGLSLDGTTRAATTGDRRRGGVPCCKHLLACLLAERWAPLGRFVVARKVGRAEMAGIVADV